MLPTGIPDATTRRIRSLPGPGPAQPGAAQRIL
jgi:hypothetical protein